MLSHSYSTTEISIFTSSVQEYFTIVAGEECSGESKSLWQWSAETEVIKKGSQNTPPRPPKKASQPIETLGKKKKKQKHVALRWNPIYHQESGIST